nr:GTP-binding protein [Candidatus Sigynarchaeota archaeon]
MERDYIAGILYSVFDERLGPNAYAWEPQSLSKNLREKVTFECMNINISAEKIPKQLSIIPFPEFGIKALVKYSKYFDKARRGGAADTVLALLFNEVDDLIFYKYIHDFEDVFDRHTVQIVECQEAGGKSQHEIHDKVVSFQSDVHALLESLHARETADSSATAFAEQDEDLSKNRFKYKIIVCGDAAVGKTSLILQFTNNAFTRSYLPTIGVNVSNKLVSIDNLTVTFVLWDVAGQQKFNLFRKQFYQGSNGIIVVYDITNAESFKSVSLWHADIKKIADDVPGLIIGNKKDLEEQRAVSKEDLAKLGESLGMMAVETSALTGENVRESFKSLGSAMLQRHGSKKE